jgi:hypothetical protein
MGSRNRSSEVELRRRVDAAAALLANGLPRTAAVTQLAERYRVDRRTARRYVADAAAELADEIGAADLAAALAESVERLNRLSHQAETRGNLNAAVGAAKAAAGTLAAIYRADTLQTARLAGHTIAVAEPSEGQRRAHRESIRPPDASWPF